MTSDDYWAPPRCLQEPIVELSRAAAALSGAVDAHLAGRFDEARSLIQQADCMHVRRWIEPMMGSTKQFPARTDLVRLRKVRDAPCHLKKAERLKPRMPTKAGEQRILARDGFRCVFCGTPVIRDQVRRRLTALYPEDAYWGERCHAALWSLWLQFDNLLPHGRGGSSDDDNVAVTCSGCNYGRMNATLEEVGLLQPSLRRDPSDDWDGLERLLRTRDEVAVNRRSERSNQ